MRRLSGQLHRAPACWGLIACVLLIAAGVLWSVIALAAGCVALGMAAGFAAAGVRAMDLAIFEAGGGGET